MRPSRPIIFFIFVIVIALFNLALDPRPAAAYSVLTHEQIVDLAWKDQIQPMLLQRFPNATPDDLRQAHAYAYGGSLIQDMGYYPRGSKYFSDLLHYVRSGEFVTALLSEAEDIDKYAFALGGAGALLLRQCRSSHGEPDRGSGISETQSQVWE